MPRVDANGVEHYYEDHGDGEPIVVLHGGKVDHRSWAEQLQPLTEQYRVLTYDLRGHGRTGPTSRDSYTVECFAADLAAVIDALELDQPVVLGHSFGGMIGYVYANQHSSALSGLVTVGSVTPHLFSTGEWLYFGVMLRVVSPVATNERILNGLTWVLEQIFDARAGADGLERLRDEHHCDVPDIHPEESEKMLDAAVEYYGSGRPVDGIDVPVLMLYGDDELPFLQAHADYLEDRLSACRTVEIPDAGHNAHADNPEFIRDRLREFMATTT